MLRLSWINLILIIVLFIPSGYAINPEKAYKLRPENFRIEYQGLKVNTSDGAALNTWIMKTPNENKKDYTFIIAGSDAGNMGYSLPYAVSLLNNGYDVVTFDYRGFGDSSDFEFKPDNLYHNEYIEDFKTIVNWTSVELAPEKIGVLAFSMGTLISIAGYEDAGYDLLIAEGFIRCPEQIVKRIKKEKGKRIYLPDHARAIRKKIKNIEIPMLLFASAKDEITTLKDSRKVVAQKQNRKLIVHDGEHLRGAFTLGMETYMNEINSIIARTDL